MGRAKNTKMVGLTYLSGVQCINQGINNQKKNDYSSDDRISVSNLTSCNGNKNSNERERPEILGAKTDKR